MNLLRSKMADFLRLDIKIQEKNREAKLVLEYWSVRSMACAGHVV
jgi:hypothetical protein